jgi:hypothetical protein
LAASSIPLLLLSSSLRILSLRYLNIDQPKHRHNSDINAFSRIRIHDPSVRANEDCVLDLTATVIGLSRRYVIEKMDMSLELQKRNPMCPILWWNRLMHFSTYDPFRERHKS